MSVDRYEKPITQKDALAACAEASSKLVEYTNLAEYRETVKNADDEIERDWFAITQSIPTKKYGTLYLVTYLRDMQLYCQLVFKHEKVAKSACRTMFMTGHFLKTEHVFLGTEPGDYVAAMMTY